jgi:imidazolonepropionase-like amidohydrolase
MNKLKSIRLKGRLIDGTGKPAIENGVVVVSGDTIAWAGPAEALPAQYADPAIEERGGPGFTVMPGLIDGHIHISFGEARSEEENALYTPPEYRALRAAWHARKVLRAGVTSAFDAASTFNVATSVRDAIAAGMNEGPRLAVCGRQITSHQGLEDSFPSWMPFPAGQAGVLVRSRDEIVEAVRLQVKEGVDCIKVSGSSDSAISNEPIEGAAFTEDEFRLIVSECHRLQRKCTVHARSRESALLTARAGFDWLMHASYIDDEGIDTCLKNGTAIVPAMTLLANILASAQPGAGASFLDTFRREYDAAAENLARAFKAGVPLIAGSESGWSLVPFGNWHAREMQILVDDLGLTPMQAIHAGTGAASRMLPRWADRIGTLEAGKLADVLLIDGNPLADITVLQKPSKLKMVMQAGRIVDIETPIADRRVWAYERHQTFLSGSFRYDETAGRGHVVN